MTDNQLFNVVLGAVVRHLRRRKGWSQEALGKRVGLTQGSVSKVEDGRTRVLIDTVRSVAAALGADVGVIYTHVTNVTERTREVAKTISRTALTQDGTFRDDLDPSGLVQFVVAAML